MESASLQIRLPRQCVLNIDNISPQRAKEFARCFREAEERRQGLVVFERRSVQVVERWGMHTGQVRTELHAAATTDVVGFLKQHLSEREQGTTLIAVLPPEAISRATLVEIETAQQRESA